jgi:hypothetical protein
MGDIIIPLPNGGTLRCGPGEFHAWGGTLSIHDANGEELLHWESTEWREDPESVIGAIFAAAAKPMDQLKSYASFRRKK